MNLMKFGLDLPIAIKKTPTKRISGGNSTGPGRLIGNWESSGKNDHEQKTDRFI